MVRTQIYLTDEEKDGLNDIARRTGMRQSEIIREALDRFLEQNKTSRKDLILSEAAGMWRGRDDLPAFAAGRISWDRGR